MSVPSIPRCICVKYFNATDLSSSRSEYDSHWAGRVVVQGLGRRSLSAEARKDFDPLEYLARFFNTIEINSSFYRPPSASTTKSWARRVEQRKEFTFTAKLNRVFTHERGKATKKDEKSFAKGWSRSSKRESSARVLLQFPWSFKNTAEDRLYLTKLLEQFPEYPLVLEVRHTSWNNRRLRMAGRTRRGNLQYRSAGVFEIDSSGGA